MDSLDSCYRFRNIQGRSLVRNRLFDPDIALTPCPSFKDCPDDLNPVVVGERHDQCLARRVKIRMGDTGIYEAPVDGFRGVDFKVWCPWPLE